MQNNMFFRVAALGIATFALCGFGIGQKECDANASAMRPTLSWARSTGILRHTELGKIVVDEALWSAATQNDKVSIAIAVYCTNGLQDFLIKGYHDGKLKASVMDGSYFNN